MAYTNIDDPSAYFQTVLYTGTSGNARQVTNDGNSNLKPDLVWIKGRSNQSHNLLYDSTRGVYKQIYSDLTNSEATVTNSLQEFSTDGFKVGSYVYANENTHTFAAWQWKANGGTTSSNTQGNVTNTLQVNSTAGFSISTFTSASSGNTTIGHGLGVAPSMFVVKGRNLGSGWWMNHAGLTNQSDRYLGLHDLNGERTLSWGAAPTSTLITMSSGYVGNGYTMVCYAFAEKQGYSKFGSYHGTGGSGSTAPIIYTGFKPAFIWIKATTTTTPAMIFDTTRNPLNLTDKKLLSSTDVAENDAGSNSTGGASANNIDILSNGFKIKTGSTGTNAAVNKYAYMAFAENPFVTSTGVPACAR